jgi:hypothetical protein
VDILFDELIPSASRKPEEPMLEAVYALQLEFEKDPGSHRKVINHESAATPSSPRLALGVRPGAIWPLISGALYFGRKSSGS